MNPATECGRLMYMDAHRSERISVSLTPDLAARLDRFAAENHWTRSTAAAVLIERGVADDREQEVQR